MSWSALQWRQFRLRQKIFKRKLDFFSLNEIIKIYPYLNFNIRSTLNPNNRYLRR